MPRNVNKNTGRFLFGKPLGERTNTMSSKKGSVIANRKTAKSKVQEKVLRNSGGKENGGKSATLGREINSTSPQKTMKRKLNESGSDVDSVERGSKKFKVRNVANKTSAIKEKGVEDGRVPKTVKTRRGVDLGTKELSKTGVPCSSKGEESVHRSLSVSVEKDPDIENKIKDMKKKSTTLPENSKTKVFTRSGRKASAFSFVSKSNNNSLNEQNKKEEQKIDSTTKKNTRRSRSMDTDETNKNSTKKDDSNKKSNLTRSRPKSPINSTKNENLEVDLRSKSLDKSFSPKNLIVNLIRSPKIGEILKKDKDVNKKDKAKIETTTRSGRKAITFSFLSNSSANSSIENKEIVEKPKEIGTKGKHVPIYKQFLLETNQTKQQKKPKQATDMYEIDFEFSEEIKAKKRKKKEANDSINMYDKKMDEIMDKIRSKLEKEKGVKFKKAPQKPKPENETKKPDLYQLYVSNLNIPHKKTFKKKNVPRKAKVETKVRDDSKVTMSRGRLWKNVDMHEGELAINDESDGEDQPEAFEEDQPSKESPKIDIISNVLVQPANNSTLDISFSIEDHPIANSTVLQPPDASSTPWRVNFATAKRNPHLLSYKKSSLPNYDQDMVIDSNFLENSLIYKSKTPARIEETSKTPFRVEETNFQLEEKTPKKQQTPAVQSSILDFVSGHSEKQPRKSQSLSLFDIDEFSPIKKDTPRKSSSPKKAKRNLNNDENAILESPPKASLSPRRNISVLKEAQTNIMEKSGEMDVDNYFGFNSTLEGSLVQQIDDSINKPTRFNLKKAKKVAEELKPSNDDDTVKDDHVSLEVSATESLGGDERIKVGLFEDLEPVFKKPTRRSYERVKIGRRRYSIVESEDEDVHLVEKKRRKKKDGMTKKEEKEAKKWYAQFNAMCEEVEKHDLAIE